MAKLIDTDLKPVIDKVKDIFSKIPKVCKSCHQGTLSGTGATLSCTFCKYPKE